MRQSSSPAVPRNTPDPIQHLLENGESVVSLASAWGFRTSDSVYRIKRFEYVPPASTAQKMAESFGWTAGDVINYWLDRVERKAASQ
jgi:hypothetical protein